MKYFLLFLLLACTHSRPPVPAEQEKVLSITEVNPDRTTALTRQNLYQVIQIYDLSRMMYTSRVQIEPQVPARSHPVLTLNTDYAETPHKLMAQWLHQQFHWLANQKADKVRACIEDLKKVISFPGKKDSVGEKFYYLHFVVNYLEYRALGKLIGYKEAYRVIKEMMVKDKHYEVVYKTIFRHPALVRKIVERHQLVPQAIL